MCLHFIFCLLMQVALNKAVTETLGSTSDLLTQTVEEQSSLMKDVSSIFKEIKLKEVFNFCILHSFSVDALFVFFLLVEAAAS